MSTCSICTSAGGKVFVWALINDVPREHKSRILQLTQLRTLSDELTAEVMDEYNPVNAVITGTSS